MDRSRDSQSFGAVVGEVIPLFLGPKTKWPTFFVFFSFAGLIYLSSNWIHLFPPRLLPMTTIDQLTPFVPATIWIYTSEYVFFAAVYFIARDFENLNKYLYAFLALQLVSGAIFWIWPTTYPREMFPLNAETTDSLTYFVFTWLRQVDTPANCCPSLHVSSVFLSTFVFLNEQKRKFPFFFLWGLAIAASTLTTKQHYLADVVFGFGLAIAVYWIFYYCIRYRAEPR